MKREVALGLLISAVISFPLLTSSCSGGGGGENEIKITSDADWIGYQADSGEWKTLSPSISSSEETDGIKTYKFKANNKYGVAFYCSEDREGNIFYFTKSELDNFTFYCNEHFNRYTVSGTHENMETGDYFAISNVDSKASLGLLSVSEIPDTTTFTISEVPEGKWDLVSVEYSANGDTVSPYKVVIKRGIEVDNNITGLTVDFLTGSSFSPHTFDVLNGEGMAWFVSENNTITLTGIKNDEINKWFQINNITNANDSYLFVGANEDSKIHVESHSATENGLGDITINLDNISDLTTGSFDSGTKTFSGLDYTPSSTSPNLVGYSISLENTNLNWDIAISKNWLGGNTSYTLPDFPSVDGFPSGAWFNDFTTIHISLSAVMSNVDVKNLVQTNPKLDFDYPVLKEGTFEIASQEVQ